MYVYIFPLLLHPGSKGSSKPSLDGTINLLRERRPNHWQQSSLHGQPGDEKKMMYLQVSPPKFNWIFRVHIFISFCLESKPTLSILSKLYIYIYICIIELTPTNIKKTAWHNRDISLSCFTPFHPFEFYLSGVFSIPRGTTKAPRSGLDSYRCYLPVKVEETSIWKWHKWAAFKTQWHSIVLVGSWGILIMPYYNPHITG